MVVVEETVVLVVVVVMRVIVAIVMAMTTLEGVRLQRASAQVCRKMLHTMRSLLELTCSM